MKRKSSERFQACHCYAMHNRQQSYSRDKCFVFQSPDYFSGAEEHASCFDFGMDSIATTLQEFDFNTWNMSDGFDNYDNPQTLRIARFKRDTSPSHLIRASFPSTIVLPQRSAQSNSSSDEFFSGDCGQHDEISNNLHIGSLRAEGSCTAEIHRPSTSTTSPALDGRIEPHDRYSDVGILLAILAGGLESVPRTPRAAQSSAVLTPPTPPQPSAPPKPFCLELQSTHCTDGAVEELALLLCHARVAGVGAGGAQ